MMNTNVIEERNKKLAENENNKLGLLFIEKSDYSKKSKEIAEWLFDKIISRNNLKGIDDLLTDVSYDDFENIIINLKPDGVRSIGSYYSLLTKYSDWCYENGFISNNNLSKMTKVTDKRLIWEKCKANRQKYFNHKTYLEVIDEIEKYEVANCEHYSTLFMSIYEGIYSKNLSALANLRKSDIKNGYVYFTDADGIEEKKLKISNNLEERLFEISNCDVWYKRAGNGIAKIKLRGKFEDSIFKGEQRKQRLEESEYNIDASIQHVLYRRLRTVTKEYLGDNSIIPLQIYISGIMYRICEELKRNEISVSKAFDDGNKNLNKVHEIIQNELDRSHYNVPVSAFRYQIKEYIHLFL